MFQNINLPFTSLGLFKVLLDKRKWIVFQCVLFSLPDSIPVKWTVHANRPGIRKCSWTVHPPCVWRSVGVNPCRIAAASSKPSSHGCWPLPGGAASPHWCCELHPGSRPSASAARFQNLWTNTDAYLGGTNRQISTDRIHMNYIINLSHCCYWFVYLTDIRTFVSLINAAGVHCRVVF